MGAEMPINMNLYCIGMNSAVLNTEKQKKGVRSWVDVLLWEISTLRLERASQTKVLWCHVPTMDFSKFIKKVMFAEQRIVGVGLHRIIVSCRPAPAGGPAYFCNKLLGFVHDREIRFLAVSFHDFSSLLADISLYCSLLPLCPSCPTALSRPGNCSNG